MDGHRRASSDLDDTVRLTSGMLTMRDQYATQLPTYHDCIPKGEEVRGRVRDETLVYGPFGA